jgi:hypothetical protein
LNDNPVRAQPPNTPASSAAISSAPIVMKKWSYAAW